MTYLFLGSLCILSLFYFLTSYYNDHISLLFSIMSSIPNYAALLTAYIL